MNAVVAIVLFRTLSWTERLIPQLAAHIPGVPLLFVDHNETPAEADLCRPFGPILAAAERTTHGAGMDRALDYCRAQGCDALVHIEPDCTISGGTWLANLEAAIAGGAAMAGGHRKTYGPIHPCPSAWRCDFPWETFDVSRRERDQALPEFGDHFDLAALRAEVADEPEHIKQYFERSWDTAQRNWWLAAREERAVQVETPDFVHHWGGSQRDPEPCLDRDEPRAKREQWEPIGRALREAYLREARIACAEFADPRVLKTDGWNEAHAKPCPGGIAGNVPGAVSVVECDARLVEQLRRDETLAGIAFDVGDIRSLPYAAGAFEVLLDCSTLDHVPPDDVLRVIAEYHRVLRPGGRLLLIAWCADEARGPIGQAWKPTQQYFFPERLIEGALAEFEIAGRQVLHSNEKGEQLVCWHARKRQERTMPWEYLDTPEWDARFLPAAGYLAGRVAGRDIVELNCGRLRLTALLPHSWQSYRANDLHQVPAETAGRVFFSATADADFAPTVERCDILLCFGLAAGTHPLESATISESFAEVAGRCRPGIILVESSQAYDLQFRVLDPLRARLAGYRTVHDLLAGPALDHPHAMRRMLILERI